MCGVFAILVPGAMEYATTAAAGAQQPNFSVDITYDVDPPEDYRLCPIKVAFTATVIGKNWPSGMTKTIAYHWERGSKIYKERTLALETPYARQSNFLRLHSERSLRGYVKFVITKPYRYVQQSDNLDILCH
jgi:hypothetical protein